MAARRRRRQSLGEAAAAAAAAAAAVLARGDVPEAVAASARYGQREAGARML